MIVQVYRNLHTGLMSVRSKATRRVVAHAEKVYLTDVDFKVSQTGKARVQRERRKNVHAYVEGTWLGAENIVWKSTPVDLPNERVFTCTPVNYNPYSPLDFNVNGVEITGSMSATVQNTAPYITI